MPWAEGRAAGNYADREDDETGTSHFTMRLNRFDKEQLDYIGKTLDVNRSEAIRTAIRVYSALLKRG